MKDNLKVDVAFDNLINSLHENRPGDKSVKDRFYAIIITDIQKIYALFYTYILHGKE